MTPTPHFLGLEGQDPARAPKPGCSQAPAVLTEPYSLPLLLMATKNRLATPKMLTTPRSTGDSSNRPGGRVRVTPGQGTLCLRLPLLPWDPHF